MILEAFQREDVLAYMGLNTAVNNSSAMTEHKYKQAVICEQELSCTSFHSDTHLTSKYNYTPSNSHKTRYARPHIQSSNTHTATVCTQKIHNRRQEWDVKSQNTANVWQQHITEEPKQPAPNDREEKRLILEGLYQEHPNIAKCVSAKFTWSSQLS